MYSLLIDYFDVFHISAAGALVAFILTFILLKIPFKFLPKDQGREYAVNGALSKGKTRGVGILMVGGFVLAGLLFMPLDVEHLIYLVLIILMMLSGFLDDASKIPWSDYKKGLIDLLLAAATSFNYVYFNDSSFVVLGYAVTIPVWLYVILGTILIWMCINVTNCSDGIDGLCANLSIVTISAYCIICAENLGSDIIGGYIMVGVIIAYLFFNTKPSTMLMGDAGSRSIGFLIALMAMQSDRPCLWLVLAIVTILDGGMGLVKVFLLRFFKISILKKTRTPYHDHLRKNKEWADTYVVYRFALIQTLICIAAYFVLGM